MMGHLLRSVPNKHVYFENKNYRPGHLCSTTDSLCNLPYCHFDNIWINCAALVKISSIFLFFFFFVEVIKEKGLEHVTVEDLMVEITPKGRGNLTGLFGRTDGDTHAPSVL